MSMLKGYAICFILLTGLVSSSAVNAEIVLATDFTDRKVDGSVVSDVSWYANGVSTTTSLTARSGSESLLFFDTEDAQGRFAVDHNLHREGEWYTDLTLSLNDNSMVTIESLSLDVMLFNNFGIAQPVQRDLDMKVELFAPDTTGSPLYSSSVYDIFLPDGENSDPIKAVTFSDVNLSMSNDVDYVFRITAFGEGVGTNAGLDRIEINGLVDVGTPSIALCTVLLSLLPGARRRVTRRG